MCVIVSDLLDSPPECAICALVVAEVLIHVDVDCVDCVLELRIQDNEGYMTADVQEGCNRYQIFVEGAVQEHKDEKRDEEDDRANQDTNIAIGDLAQIFSRLCEIFGGVGTLAFSFKGSIRFVIHFVGIPPEVTFRVNPPRYLVHDPAKEVILRQHIVLLIVEACLIIKWVLLGDAIGCPVLAGGDRILVKAIDWEFATIVVLLGVTTGA